MVGTEETIARRFVHFANLRHILEQTGTPEVIKIVNRSSRNLSILKFEAHWLPTY